MSIMSKIPGFRKNADRSFTQEEFVTALTDMQAGRNSTGNARELQKDIKAYISKHLNTGRKIGPGAFTTGFTHIIRADSNEVVVPDDKTLKVQAEIVRELTGAALAHANNPDAAPICNVFVLEDVLCGRVPSVGKDAAPFHWPVYGRDLHDNEVFLLQGQHPMMAKMAEELLHTHTEAPVSLGSDPFASVRAAWLASLLQVPSTKLEQVLEEHGVDEEMAKRLSILAKHLREPGNLEKFAGEIKGADSIAGSNYPEGSEHAALNLDKDLKTATTHLLKGVRDTVYGGPIITDLDKIEEDGFVSSHIFSVTNALGACGVIQGIGDGDLKTMSKTISVSLPGVVGEIGQLHADDQEGHVSKMIECCKGRPILVRLANNEYMLRMPLMAGQSNAAATGEPVPAGATPQTPTADAAAGLRVQAEVDSNVQDANRDGQMPNGSDPDGAQAPATGATAGDAGSPCAGAPDPAQPHPPAAAAPANVSRGQDPAVAAAARDAADLLNELKKHTPR